MSLKQHDGAGRGGREQEEERGRQPCDGPSSVLASTPDGASPLPRLGEAAPGRPGHTGRPMEAVYAGEFGVEQATRLLWRAGFGPKPGEAERLAKLGLERRRPLADAPRPRAARRPGAARRQARPLAPHDAWGHDHLWWLDRMVRTTTPLVERMTLVWHDWFATSNAASARSG